MLLEARRLLSRNGVSIQEWLQPVPSRRRPPWRNSVVDRMIEGRPKMTCVQSLYRERPRSQLLFDVRPAAVEQPVGDQASFLTKLILNLLRYLRVLPHKHLGILTALPEPD